MTMAFISHIVVRIFLALAEFVACACVHMKCDISASEFSTWP